MLSVHSPKDPPWAVIVGSNPGSEALENLGCWPSVSPFVIWCPKIPTLASLGGRGAGCKAGCGGCAMGVLTVLLDQPMPLCLGTCHFLSTQHRPGVALASLGVVSFRRFSHEGQVSQHIGPGLEFRAEWVSLPRQEGHIGRQR